MAPNYLATFRRAVREAEGCEKSELSEKSPATYDPLAPLDGEEPSVWRVIRLRACMAYNYTTWCVSDPRRPARCIHCRRALSPEEQGNTYGPL